MEIIHTDNAPAAIGHYSQATVSNGVVYVAGQLPIDPASGAVVEGEIEAQTAQALANVEAILTEAGSSLSQILRATVYITDLSLFARLNATYAAKLGDHKPARAVVPVSELPKGAMIEISAIAAIG